MGLPAQVTVHPPQQKFVEQEQIVPAIFFIPLAVVIYKFPLDSFDLIRKQLQADITSPVNAVNDPRLEQQSKKSLQQ